MKLCFTKHKMPSNLFLLSIFIQNTLVILIILYYFNFDLNFYKYILSLYFNNLISIINKLTIFFIGIFGSFWAYINHKRTNNMQFIFYYCFNLYYVYEPIKMLLSYFLILELKNEFYFLIKFHYFLFLFSLFSLVFLSLYICDLEIKSLGYALFIVLLLSSIITIIIPINSYEYKRSFNFLLKIKNIKLYIDLVLIIILLNFLIEFIRKKNISYFLIFMSIFLILTGLYLNFFKIHYSFIIISIGTIIYFKKANKILF